MTTSADSSKSMFAFLRSPRFPIFMIVFVDVLGLGITLPVLPLFAQNELKADPAQITALTSVFFAAQFIAAPYLGRLSDRVGRRPVLILSQTGTLLALLITGLAPAFFLLYVARAIDGFTGGNITVAQAYLSDITDERNRARGMGTVSAAFGMAFVFGPAFGSFIASWAGPRIPFVVAAGVSLCTILLTFFLLPESLTRERRQKMQAHAAQSGHVRSIDLLRAPSMTILMIIAFGSQLAFFCFQPIYVLWAERLVFPGQPETVVQQMIGLILTLIGLYQIVTQFWLVGPLVRRLGEKKLVMAGNAVRAVAFAGLAFSPTLATSFLVGPLLALGGGVSLPALVALITYAAPPARRGQAIGLQQSANALGSVLGPLMTGALFRLVHPNASMIAAATLMGLTVLAGLPIFRLPMHPPAHSLRTTEPASSAK